MDGDENINVSSDNSADASAGSQQTNSPATDNTSDNINNYQNDTERESVATSQESNQDNNVDAHTSNGQSSANNSGQASAPNEQPIEDIMYVYKSKLIEDLGFKDLPDIEKKQIEEKIDTLVNQRILNLLLLYIPKEKAEELADKAESGDEAEFYKFVAENIPGWSDKVFKELELIKDEVLGKTDKLNG